MRNQTDENTPNLLGGWTTARGVPVGKPEDAKGVIINPEGTAYKVIERDSLTGSVTLDEAPDLWNK